MIQVARITRGRCLLKVRIKEANTTQAELARKSGYSPQRISNWANNREPMPYEVAVLISYMLNCHAEDMYEWIL
ncbi:helix-turn-helix domain-containing protein [Paenibacillus melissococcoides]|uniref:helix-turn-helix domain-containing protein n=1 Tax=Paenibacillus melissococcoides TaxID=2912268 RepID=UPI0029056640|nr:helix-turn-helix transcriptional regulator [Paenibacillus melissococcoides]